MKTPKKIDAKKRKELFDRMKDFADKFDYRGLVTAYEKSNIELGAKEWKEFIEHIKKQFQKEKKALICACGKHVDCI